ncbi:MULTISPECIES: hypothetical protein [Salipiger]|uniref:hypothetical protein n=1 Tax=Salipiger TaxID=263377 RepID=UPI003512EE69
MDADNQYNAPAGEYESCRSMRASELPVRSGEAILAAMCAIPVALVVAALTSLHFKLELAPALALYTLVGGVVMFGLLAYRLWRAGPRR